MTDHTLKRLERARTKEAEAQSEYHAAVSRRQAREERLRQLENQASQAEADADRTALLPGGGEAVQTATREVDRIKGEISELRDEVDAARDRWDDAQEHREEVARSLAPEAAEDLVRAREAAIEAYADLGRAVLEATAEVERALAHQSEVQDRFEQVKKAADPSSIQRRELENFVDSPGDDASPESEVGWLALRLVRWYARIDRAEVRELLARHGLAARGGSILSPNVRLIAGLGQSGAISTALHEGRSLPY